MSTQLKREGNDAECVYTGSEVITKGIIYKPNILILDVQMNEIDSTDIVRVFRLLPYYKNLPILLYSFYKVSELGSENLYLKTSQIDACHKNCLDLGATKYLGRFNEITFLKLVGKYF